MTVCPFVHTNLNIEASLVVVSQVRGQRVMPVSRELWRQHEAVIGAIKEDQAVRGSGTPLSV